MTRGIHTGVAVGVLVVVVVAPVAGVAAVWQPSVGEAASERATTVDSLHVDRLHLRNVRVEYAATDRACLGRSLALGNVSVSGEVCEAVTARRAVALNVTLHNVTFEGLALRNQSLAREVVGGAAGGSYGNVSVGTVTLSGVGIRAATFGVVRAGNVTWRSARVQTDADVEPPSNRSESASLSVDAVRVERAVVGELEAGAVSLDNETSETGANQTVVEPRSRSDTGAV